MAWRSARNPTQRRRRWVIGGCVAVALAAVGLLWVCATPLGADWLFDTLERYPALSPSRIAAEHGAPETAIVILAAGRVYLPVPQGAGLDVGPDDNSLDRLRYGASLAHQTGLPVLISGGLPSPTSPPLAVVLAASLESTFGLQPR